MISYFKVNKNNYVGSISEKLQTSWSFCVTDEINMGFKLCYAFSQGIVCCNPAHETADNKKITGVNKKYESVIVVATQ